MSRKFVQRSSLGQSRPLYRFTCGVCGKVIEGRSNTVHLGIFSHIRAEFKRGERPAPYTHSQLGDLGQKWR